MGVLHVGQVVNYLARFPPYDDASNGTRPVIGLRNVCRRGLRFCGANGGIEEERKLMQARYGVGD